jgi:SAM-dependent methyltransferase
MTPAAPGWVLDEVASAGRENLDLAHVTSYDDKADASATAEVALLVDLGLEPRSHVVDLGAGTGQFTLAVASACARVVAVDVSPVMLNRLRAKLIASGASNVEVIDSRWALHHLPDFWKALALVRMRRILRPGGVLRLSDVVYSFEPTNAEERVERWCASLPDEPPSDGRWVRADLEEHVRDEHSTFTWLLEPVIERSGFSIEQATYTTDRIFAEYIARAV